MRPTRLISSWRLGKDAEHRFATCTPVAANDVNVKLALRSAEMLGRRQLAALDWSRLRHGEILSRGVVIGNCELKILAQPILQVRQCRHLRAVHMMSPCPTAATAE
jgi:hypothetical protein